MKGNEAFGHEIIKQLQEKYPSWKMNVKFENDRLKIQRNKTYPINMPYPQHPNMPYQPYPPQMQRSPYPNYMQPHSSSTQLPSSLSSPS
jgi:hypothetical protein